jgi:hypothetical protein
MIKVNWDVEELVALVDVYERASSGLLQDLSEELESLSNVLVKRADLLGIGHDEKYRNLNGLKMMYQNLQYVMSDGEKGLSGASRAMYDVCDFRKKCPTVFEMLLNEFNTKYRQR